MKRARKKTFYMIVDINCTPVINQQGDVTLYSKLSKAFVMARVIGEAMQTMCGPVEITLKNRREK